MQEIEETDARFRAATHEVDKPIVGSGNAAWWWMRVPNVLVGELRRDFESGLAD
jgi:hypothetical protein